MKILDKYIYRKFFFTFLFMLIITVVLILVFDLLEKNDTYSVNKVEIGSIIQYYKNFIPYMINTLIPIIIFLSTVLVTSGLCSKSEIIAILNLGIPYWRFLLPFIFIASIIGTTNFISNGWLLAHGNAQRIAFEDKYFHKPLQSNTSNIHIKLDQNRFIYIKYYSFLDKKAEDVFIETFNDNVLMERIYAQEMIWDDDLEQWMLSNWIKRQIEDRKENVSSGDVMSTNVAIKYDDLILNPKMQEFLTITELNRYIDKLDKMGSSHINTFKAEKTVRYMSPFASIILTLLGVMLCSRKTRRGNTPQIIASFLLAFLYFGLFMIVKALANYDSSANILLIIWMPNIIYMIINILLYIFLPK